MSDPGTTYRQREEVQKMRSTQDPIMGLKKSMIEWGVADEATLKSIDQAAKKEVDQAVVEAKECEEPDIEVEFWTDIYFKGTEPPFMRGREKEYVGCAFSLSCARRSLPTPLPCRASSHLGTSTTTTTDRYPSPLSRSSSSRRCRPLRSPPPPRPFFMLLLSTSHSEGQASCAATTRWPTPLFTFP
jgi:hypothetical protein